MTEEEIKAVLYKHGITYEHDAYSADNYHAVLDQIETDSGLEWEASYPGIPGVVGGGKTKEEALADAEDNLKAHLEFLKEDGVEPPKREK